MEGGPDQIENIKTTLEFAPGVYCFGGDQTSSWNKELEALLDKQGTKIVHIPRYKSDLYSTTAIYFSDQKGE